MSATLGELIEELEAVADKLRSGAVDPDEGADLVERCADLAARIGSQLDARARSAAEVPEARGQERLL